jgi:hypothetical protein
MVGGGASGNGIGQRIEREYVAPSGRRAELHHPMRGGARVA